jgi:hypothetical protein
MHVDKPSFTGREIIGLHTHIMTYKSMQRALPWTGWHISTQYPNPPLRSTIPCGLQRQPWKKTSGVERHGVLFSRGGPPPLPSSWQLIMPSLDPTPGGSDLWTHPHHCAALADIPCAPLITSSETVDSFTLRGSVTKSRHTAAPSP